MSKEKSLEARAKRAESLVAMNLVKRSGDRFLVGAKQSRGKQGQHEVWRDEQKKVRCTCEDFAEAIKSDPKFRCEHIIAIKLSLARVMPEMAKTAKGNSVTDISERMKPSVSSSDHGQSQLSVVRPQSPAKENTRKMPTEYLNHPLEVKPEADEARTSASFCDLLKRLSAPIPEEFIKQREGWRDRNGETHFVDYIEWHTVADLLDQIAPDWSHSVRAIVQIGGIVAVTAAITIQGVTREGVGTGPAESETGIKKAEHDALKRAAVKFGMARELYQRDDDGEHQSAAAPTLPKDPLAKSLPDLITPKQLVAIRAIAHAQGVKAEEECQTLYQCKLEELSRKAASALIDHLKSRPQQGADLQQEAAS